MKWTFISINIFITLFQKNDHKDRKRKRKPIKPNKDDEEIESSSDEETTHNKHDEEPSDDDYETVQEKKVRLAKLYLEEIAKEGNCLDL